MKRLHYTSCRTGRSVSGASGFQIRAATPGLSPYEQATALAVAQYWLPAGSPVDIPSDKPPRRLALINISTGGRVVCHSASVGRDPETGRFGNFFTDLLIGTEDELEPLSVI